MTGDRSSVRAEPASPRAAEMVERVTRAICLSECPDPNCRRYGRCLAIGDALRSERNEARAAIAAMRVPTNRMIKASKGALKVYIESLPDNLRRERVSWHGYGVSWKEKMVARWQAMIDAALPQPASSEVPNAPPSSASPQES